MSNDFDRKKIALFMTPLLTHGGGAEKYFIELAKNLASRGFIVDIITFDRNFCIKLSKFLSLIYFRKMGTIERETEESVIRQLGDAKWIKTPLKNLKNVLKDYEVIYSKNEIIDLFLLKFYGGKKIPPVIVGVHTPIFYPSTKSLISKIHNILYLGFFYKYLLRIATSIHLSNQFTKDLVDNRFKINSELIYYPFSSDDMRNRSLINISDLKFDNEKINIVFIARLTEQKGVNSFIEIIEKLSMHPDFIKRIFINIFGSGDLEDAVIECAKKYSFLRYYGHIENKFVPNILSRSDLFVSTAKWETLPFNILEAQSLGLPVIAFDIPGPSDIIVNDVTGYLAKNENDFVHKILNFNKNSFNSSIIIQNINNKFNPDLVYEGLSRMFKKNIL